MCEISETPSQSLAQSAGGRNVGMSGWLVGRREGWEGKAESIGRQAGIHTGHACLSFLPAQLLLPSAHATQQPCVHALRPLLFYPSPLPVRLFLFSPVTPACQPACAAMLPACCSSFLSCPSHAMQCLPAHRDEFCSLPFSCCRGSRWIR